MMSSAAAHRRALHAIPELDTALPLTRAYILDALKALPCKVSCAADGIFAYFDMGRKTAVAVRADMDALPIAERTGLPFASKHEGRMHACGHDGHMAMLLALAQALSDIKGLKRNVLLVFQPAEETGGGARGMCSCGIMQGYHVERVFGCHIWPALEKGRAFSRSGAMMAGSREINLDITGRSSHIAHPERGADALLMGAEFLRGVYERERALNTLEPRLLRFGLMQSGSVRNAIADAARLEGSMRFFSRGTEALIFDALEAASKESAQHTGCTYSFSYSCGYPPLVNDTALFEAAAKRLGPDMGTLDGPSMASEDFGFYGEAFPALFLFLGAGETPPLHSGTYDFDESILDRGVELYLRLLDMD